MKQGDIAMIATLPQKSKALGSGLVKASVSPKKFMPKEADQKRHRHEHHRDDRQRLHDVVGAVGNDRKVGLERARDQVAQALGDIVNPHHVVVEVAKVHAVLRLDRLDTDRGPAG